LASGAKGENRAETWRCERKLKIPVKTFPIKKRINTELFIHGEVKLVYKSKRGIRSLDLLEEGRILAGNK